MANVEDTVNDRPIAREINRLEKLIDECEFDDDTRVSLIINTLPKQSSLSPKRILDKVGGTGNLIKTIIVVSAAIGGLLAGLWQALKGVQ